MIVYLHFILDVMVLKSTLISFILALAAITTAQNFRKEAHLAKVKTLSSANVVRSSLKHNTVLKRQIQESSVVKMQEQCNVLKASKVAQLVPKAIFKRPVGSYLPSLIGASDLQYLGSNYSFTGIMGSAYSKPWVFSNHSTGATAYTWAWGTNTTYSTSTDLILKDDVENFLYPGDFFSPELTATNGSQSASYKLAVVSGASNALLMSSSNIAYVGNMDFYGNASTTDANGISVGLFSASGAVGMNGSGVGYFWGTCLRNQDGANGTLVNSIVSVYEKPMSPLTIKDICYFGNTNVAIPVPAAKKLSATILKINANGEITTDTIAKATISGANVVKDASGVYLPFVFSETDKTSGVKSTIYPVVSDAFAIVLSGIDQEGLNFGLYSDVDNTLESTSYFTKVDAVNGDPVDGLFRSAGSGMNIALTMNAYFNYLYVEPSEQVLTAPTVGGAAIDALNKQSGALVYSFFYDVKDSLTNENLIWLPTALPDWLSLSYSDQYYKQYGGLLFQFTATALPSGLAGRTADVKIQSYGAETTITINQGVVSAIENNDVAAVMAVKNSSGYALSYNSDYESVQLTTLAGQAMGTYRLPTSGTYQLHATSIPKGIYLLQFKGLKSKTIKIIY